VCTLIYSLHIFLFAQHGGQSRERRIHVGTRDGFEIRSLFNTVPGRPRQYAGPHQRAEQSQATRTCQSLRSTHESFIGRRERNVDGSIQGRKGAHAGDRRQQRSVCFQDVLAGRLRHFGRLQSSRIGTTIANDTTKYSIRAKVATSEGMRVHRTAITDAYSLSIDS
jgi:hypothetical protein